MELGGARASSVSVSFDGRGVGARLTNRCVTLLEFRASTLSADVPRRARRRWVENLSSERQRKRGLQSLLDGETPLRMWLKNPIIT